MKGVIFNYFEEFVVEHWGDDFYEDLLGSCELITKEPFVGPGTYPDEDLLALLGLATQRLNVEVSDALRMFGRWLFPRLLDGYPDSLAFVDHPAAFLSLVDRVIHVEVRKLHPEARTPTVELEALDSGDHLLHYRSERKLCALAEGLLQGVGDRFGYQIQAEHRTCMNDGAERCTLVLQMQRSEVEVQ